MQFACTFLERKLKINFKIGYLFALRLDLFINTAFINNLAFIAPSLDISFVKYLKNLTSIKYITLYMYIGNNNIN